MEEKRENTNSDPGINSTAEQANSHLSTGTLVRQGSTLSVLTFISRILGLLREMTKARFLGTTALSDAFAVAFMLPNLFRRLFAEGSIAVAFIPTFKEHLIENNREKTREFLSSFFTFLVFLVTIMVVIGILAAPLLIKLIGVEEYDEAVLLTKIMFPFLGLMSLAALFQGILNSHHIFTPSGFGPILLNIVTILCAYGLSPYTQNPARAMAVGILIGGTLSIIIQIPSVIKLGQRFSFTGLRHAVNNPGTKKVLALISPTIIGMAAYQLNEVVCTTVAGRAGEGIVSSLRYSLRLQELILGVFAVSIGTVLLPKLAEYAKTSQWETFNERLVSAINIIALITIPITFFSLMEGENLIRVLFYSQSFDNTSVRLTLSAFMFHMPGVFFIALNRILAPAFYAQSDTKSPTIAGLISFTVNMVLAIILAKSFSGAGIAFALSFASAVNTILLLVFLKKNPKISLGHAAGSTLIYVVKLCLISGAALIPVYFLSPVLTNIFPGGGRLLSYGLPFFINGIIFALTGFLLLVLTKDKYFLSIVKMIKNKNLKT